MAFKSVPSAATSDLLPSGRMRTICTRPDSGPPAEAETPAAGRREPGPPDDGRALLPSRDLALARNQLPADLGDEVQASIGSVDLLAKSEGEVITVLEASLVQDRAVNVIWGGAGLIEVEKRPPPERI